MRFDDTNPEKEDTEYVDFMYRAVEHLIGAGYAYVDEQSAEDMHINRSDFKQTWAPWWMA